MLIPVPGSGPLVEVPLAEADPPRGPLQDQPDVGVEGTGHARQAPVDLTNLQGRDSALL